MTRVNYICSLLLLMICVFIGLYESVSTALMVLLSFAVLLMFIKGAYRSSNKDSSIISTYFCVFVSYLLYATLCFVYMSEHRYDYLLSYDTIDIILPNIDGFTDHSQNSIYKGFSVIWSDYTFLGRFQAGYYSVLFLWNILSNFLAANQYFTLQVCTLAICSIISVVIYKIFRCLQLSENSSSKYSIIICLCSTLLFYNTVLLRDGFIALFFVYCIYLFFLPISNVNIIKLLVTILITMTFRIETGLALTIFIPFYILCKRHELKKHIVICAVAIVFSVGLCTLFVLNFQELSLLYQMNYEWYSADVTEGNGIIALLQKLPPIISDILSILYTAIQPLPCWLKMSPLYDVTRPECYNMMAFPTAVSGFFNLYVIVYLLFSIKIHKNTQQANNSIKVVKIALIPVLIFLMIQSSVVAQRRIMGAYVLFYILWGCFHNNQSRKHNNYIFCMSIIIFVCMQIFSYIYIS